jgi:hypothetical protein
MSGDVPVRFCERLGVRLPRATHPGIILLNCEAVALIHILPRTSRYARLRNLKKPVALKQSLRLTWEFVDSARGVEMQTTDDGGAKTWISRLRSQRTGVGANRV